LRICVYLVVGPRHQDGVADIVKQLEQEVDREILDEATLGRTNERERDAGVATGRFDDVPIWMDFSLAFSGADAVFPTVERLKELAPREQWHQVVDANGCRDACPTKTVDQSPVQQRLQMPEIRIIPYLPRRHARPNRWRCNLTM
jgi:hypothetical protein